LGNCKGGGFTSQGQGIGNGETLNPGGNEKTREGVPGAGGIHHRNINYVSLGPDFFVAVVGSVFAGGKDDLRLWETVYQTIQNNGNRRFWGKSGQDGAFNFVDKKGINLFQGQPGNLFITGRTNLVNNVRLTRYPFRAGKLILTGQREKGKTGAGDFRNSAGLQRRQRVPGYPS
jgi:hypothetical protein